MAERMVRAIVWLLLACEARMVTFMVWVCWICGVTSDDVERHRDQQKGNVGPASLINKPRFPPEPRLPPRTPPPPKRTS